LLLCVFAICPLRLSAATNDLSGLLQKGLFEEEANRNLDAAVQAYQALVTAFDQDRKLAATAVFRLGECYRKLGKTNEAVLQYERIVREFADETTLATLSRQNLAGVGLKNDAPGSLAISHAARQEQKKLLEAEIKLAEQDLAEVKKQVEAGRATQQDQRNKEREILQLRRQLATLDAAPAEAAASPAFTDRLQSIVRRADANPSPDDEEAEIRRLQALLQNSPDLINDASGGMTPLCQAASKGQLRVAIFLLDHGAAIDRPAGNKTPLHHAVARGNKAMVELLLQRGADVNAKDGSGGTALHEAAQDGFLSVAEVLVQHKADLNARNSQRNGEQSPLHLAANKGHRAMAEFLIAQGAELDAMDTRGWTPLFDAMFRGHAELLAKLLATGAKRDVVDKEGRTALSCAAELADLDSVEALLVAKTDPNVGKVNLPIHAAVHGKNLKVLEALLNAGAEVNRSAPVKYEIKTSGMTFGQGVGVTVTPLFLAVAERNPDAAELLLKHKADANGKTPDGTPLVAYACMFNQPDILKLLLDAGADPNLPYGLGDYTALRYATADRNAPLVRLLLNHKADPNIRDESGQTPLDIVKKMSEPSVIPQAVMPARPWAVASPAELEALLRQHGAKEGSQLPEPAKSPEKP